MPAWRALRDALWRVARRPSRGRSVRRRGRGGEGGSAAGGRLRSRQSARLRRRSRSPTTTRSPMGRPHAVRAELLGRDRGDLGGMSRRGGTGGAAARGRPGPWREGEPRCVTVIRAGASSSGRRGYRCGAPRRPPRVSPVATPRRSRDGFRAKAREAVGARRAERRGQGLATAARTGRVAGAEVAAAALTVEEPVNENAGTAISSPCQLAHHEIGGGRGIGSSALLAAQSSSRSGRTRARLRVERTAAAAERARSGRARGGARRDAEGALVSWS